MKQDTNHFLLIGILLLLLSSCSGAPKRYLAADAALISPGQGKEEVIQAIGPPDATRVVPSGDEEWYYYSLHQSVLDRIPVIRSFADTERVEALQVVFSRDTVKKIQYYVPVP